MLIFTLSRELRVKKNHLERKKNNFHENDIT